MAKRKLTKAQKIAGAVIALVILGAAILQAGGFDWRSLLAETGLRSDSEAAGKPFSVHFLDVGQGDCILIKSGQEFMLIDSGESEYEKKITEYLKNNNVDKLKYVVATHPHSDHIGSLPGVFGEFEVENVIMPRLSKKNIPTTRVYENLLRAIKSSGAKTIAAKANAEYFLGEAKITILGPVKDTSDLNDMSVILRVDYKENSFLFTGDAEIPAENELIENEGFLDADVLMAGHHGSKTSSGEKFLSAVLPELVIISCGSGNKYGHPHKEALERFEKIGAEILRTDICSAIVIGSNGSELFVNYENGEYAGREAVRLSSFFYLRERIAA